MEFYFWQGDEFNPSEIAMGGPEKFLVRGVGNVFRKSPRTRQELDNPENGWVKLVPANDND